MTHDPNTAWDRLQQHASTPPPPPTPPDHMDPNEALGRITTIAQINAHAAASRGRTNEHRRWLDILAITERARP